jgi:hypothetical protein
VVADLELSPAQLGRVDTATASDGREIPRSIRSRFGWVTSAI